MVLKKEDCPKCGGKKTVNVITAMNNIKKWNCVKCGFKKEKKLR